MAADIVLHPYLWPVSFASPFLSLWLSPVSLVLYPVSLLAVLRCPHSPFSLSGKQSASIVFHWASFQLTTKSGPGYKDDVMLSASRDWTDCAE